MWVRVGRPLDVFGNFVDENGISMGPNGTTIDPKRYFMTRGEIRAVPQRDREYTMLLGKRISERYHAENVVLSSHLVAYSLFSALRKQYPALDLFRFLTLSRAQRMIPEERFFEEAELCFAMVRKASDEGRLHLSNALQCGDVRIWVEDGVRQLGLFHDAKVVKSEDGAFSTEDMSLLYYYRNRLTGYGFGSDFAGETDEQGFLV
jgi:glycerol-3-phosphate O-acyltransferase